MSMVSNTAANVSWEIYDIHNTLNKKKVDGKIFFEKLCYMFSAERTQGDFTSAYRSRIFFNQSLQRENE